MKLFVNILSILRIFLALIIFISLISKSGYLTAFILFFIAGLTDYLDGYLARKYNVISEFGEILDPIADKILIIFVFFALAVNLNSYLVGFMASIIISREIWVSALRDHNARKNNASATKVIYLAKVKTTIQLFTISVYLFGLAFSQMLLIIFGDIFLIVSTLITLYTGYVYTRNTFNN
tara:strand:- start:172 stop:708 length:537 start_codon:yes stop_codon:yes gene_type:complete